MKKAQRDSLQSEQDWQVRVQEIYAGAGSSRKIVIKAEEGGDVDPPVDYSTIADIVLIVEKSIDDYSRTQPEGLHKDVV